MMVKIDKTWHNIFYTHLKFTCLLIISIKNGMPQPACLPSWHSTSFNWLSSLNERSKMKIATYQDSSWFSGQTLILTADQNSWVCKIQSRNYWNVIKKIIYMWSSYVQVLMHIFFFKNYAYLVCFLVMECCRRKVLLLFFFHLQSSVRTVWLSIRKSSTQAQGSLQCKMLSTSVWREFVSYL